MKRSFAIAFGINAAGWSVYAAAGKLISTAVAARSGGAIVRLGEGKIISAADFVQHRFFEGLWLATLLLIWAAVHAVVAKWRRREASRRWNWIPHTAAAFVCLNLWFSQAERT